MWARWKRHHVLAARAEEARVPTEQLKSPESRRILFGIAVSCVALPKIAEEQDAALTTAGTEAAELEL
jgi:hypothetical protein